MSQYNEPIQVPVCSVPLGNPQSESGQYRFQHSKYLLVFIDTLAMKSSRTDLGLANSFWQPAAQRRAAMTVMVHPRLMRVDAALHNLNRLQNTALCYNQYFSPHSGHCAYQVSKSMPSST
jgi:hypothetical protein